MSKNIYSLFVLSLISLATLASGDVCDMQMENLEKLAETFKGCIVSTKFSFPIFKEVKDADKFLADFAAGGFDDKCFGKCLSEKLNLVKDNKLDRVEFAKLVKITGAGDDLNKKMSNIWNTCADTVENQKDFDICKFAAKFEHCVITEIIKIKADLPKC